MVINDKIMVEGAGASACPPAFHAPLQRASVIGTQLPWWDQILSFCPGRAHTPTQLKSKEHLLLISEMKGISV